MCKIVRVKHTSKNLLPDLCNFLRLFTKEYYSGALAQKELDSLLFFTKEDIVKNEIKEGKYQYYIVVYENQNVGFVQLQLEEDALILSKIFISNKFRRKGISTKLLAEIKNMALENNCEEIQFSTGENYKKLQLIIKKWGFAFSKKNARYLGDDIYIYEDMYSLRVHVK